MSNFDPLDHAVDIDVDTINKASSVHRGSPWPTLCRRIIHEMIVQQEPQFIFNKRVITTADTSPLFREIIRRHWVPFTVQCYDELMVAGFVVVRLIKIKTGDRIPVALNSDQIGKTHKVTTAVDPETTQTVIKVYRLVDKRTGQKLDKPVRDRKAKVISGFGWDPTPDGKITSLVASLLNSEEIMTRFQQFNFLTEYNLSLPTLMTESDKDSARLEETEIGQYADMDQDRARNEGSFRRKAADAQSVTFGKSFKADDRIPVWLPHGEEPEARRFFTDNILPLPHGHRIARQQLPTRNAQYAEHIRKYEELVGSVYGVPRGLVVQDVGNRTSSNASLVNEVIRRTMSLWTTIISRILTSVYRCLYHPHDCNFMLGIIPKTKFPMEEKDLFRMAQKIANVHVVIAMPSTADTNQLITLWLLGAATWEEVHGSLRNMAGMTPAPPPPEPSKSIVVQGGEGTKKADPAGIAIMSALQQKQTQ